MLPGRVGQQFLQPPADKFRREGQGLGNVFLLAVENHAVCIHAEKHVGQRAEDGLKLVVFFLQLGCPLHYPLFEFCVQLIQLLLRRFLNGDVVHHPAQAQAVIILGDDRDVVAHPYHASVGSQQPVFQAMILFFPRCVAQRIPDHLPVIGMAAVPPERGLGKPIADRVPQNLLGLLADEFETERRGVTFPDDSLDRIDQHDELIVGTAEVFFDGRQFTIPLDKGLFRIPQRSHVPVYQPVKVAGRAEYEKPSLADGEPGQQVVVVNVTGQQRIGKGDPETACHQEQDRVFERGVTGSAQAVFPL